ncbi:unnamed protein product [Protopolystoma xenopodis]|uniref:Uncharacterized protein n=1 Tax=Protopolystoma xenopodis TaxID=117903 RepID=A0A3S5BKD4_9PLAT|nr:unnamed protein product [Protopolystoma xenopodis]
MIARSPNPLKDWFARSPDRRNADQPRSGSLGGFSSVVSKPDLAVSNTFLRLEGGDAFGRYSPLRIDYRPNLAISCHRISSLQVGRAGVRFTVSSRSCIGHSQHPCRVRISWPGDN